MNCLTEALGLSLPGNGSILATHADRKRLFVEAGHLIVDLARRYYEQDDATRAAAQRSPAKGAFENAMTLDIAMGGSTNTVLHLLAAAHEGGIDFTMADIDRLSRAGAGPLQGRAGQGRRPHGGRPPRRRHHGDPRRARPRRPDRHATLPTVHAADPGRRPRPLGHRPHQRRETVRDFYRAAPGGVPTQVAFSQDAPLGRARPRPRDGRHPLRRARLLARTAASPCSTATSPRDGCIVKTAGVDESILKFTGPARVFESQDAAVNGILGDKVEAGDVVRDPLRGPEGRPRHAGDALPDELPEVEGPRQGLRPDHRRPLLRRHLGPVDRPRLARGGRGRHDRPRPRRRPDRDRHPEPHHPPRRRRRRARRAAGRRRRRAGWKPAEPRKRKVTTALQAYAAFATSAARGAVRVVPE